MKKLNILTTLTVLFGAGLLLLSTSCTSSKTATNQSTSVQLIKNKSGAQLWSENCMRCHNTPPPNLYNDQKWDVIKDHMRVKANLTGVEAEKIFKFLKSAN